MKPPPARIGISTVSPAFLVPLDDDGRRVVGVVLESARLGRSSSVLAELRNRTVFLSREHTQKIADIRRCSYDWPRGDMSTTKRIRHRPLSAVLDLLASRGLTIALVILAAFGIPSPADATCTTVPCQPGTYFQLSHGQTVQFNLASLQQTERDAFASAMAVWDTALSTQAGQFSVNFEQGPNEYEVSFDTSLVGTDNWAITNWGTKVIRFNPEVLGYPGFFHKVALHELGHVSGFADVTVGGPCSIYSSIMTAGWGGGQGPNTLEQADNCAITRVYNIPESPIILNLDGGGLELTGPEILFDLVGDGDPNYVGWTSRGAGEGFLVLDRNRDGRINTGREMFGNHTPLSWGESGPAAAHGFEALEWFDSPDQGGDGDRWITSADRVFPALRAWIDDNHNGVSEPEELFSMNDIQVIALSTEARGSHRVDSYGNRFRYRAKMKLLDSRGRLRTDFAYDVFLVSF